MKNDYSKINEIDKHYSKVNIQQGSILLDSDLNEESDIQNYRHRTSLQDVIGSCGVPAENPGFKIVGNTEPLFAWENITVQTNPDNERLKHFIRNNFDTKWLDDLEKLEPHKLFFKSTDGKTISATSGTQSQGIDIILSDDGTTASLSVDSVRKYDFIVRKGEDNKAYLHTKWYRIGAGHCYVDGILMQNENEVEATRQRDFPVPFRYDVTSTPFPSGESGRYLVYLRGWERLITPLQDPEIAEKAVGDANTTTRTKVVWQVCVAKVPPDTKCSSPLQTCDISIQTSSCKLRARSKPTIPTNEPCLLPPSAGYRGLENQLYRIEIHNSGAIDSGATFKWSRDNGARRAKVLEFSPGQLLISGTGLDLRLAFAPGHLIEILDDRHELLGAPGTLARVKEVKDGNILILEEGFINGDELTDQNFPQEFHPLVVKWDCPDLTPAKQGDIELEDGILINLGEGTCKTGDYWTVPARTAVADVEWPKMGGNNNTPIAKLPQGIKYHYCRLAIINYDEGSQMISVIEDCRKIFPPITEARGIATTGIVKLNFNLAVTSPLVPGKGYFFGPFDHSLKGLEHPPAIILGLANSNDVQTRVKFMEDYALGRVGGQGPIHFKAVNIGLEKFLVSISVESRIVEGRPPILPIRWYALPAQQRPEQDSEEIPKISFADKDFNTLTEIPSKPFLPGQPIPDNSFLIVVNDPVVSMVSQSTEKIKVKIGIKNSSPSPNERSFSEIECIKLKEGVFVVRLINTVDDFGPKLFIEDGMHPDGIEIGENGLDELKAEYVHSYDCRENTVTVAANIKPVSGRPPIL